MSSRSKSKSGKRKKQLQKSVLTLFRKEPKKPLNYKQVSASLGVKDPEERKLVYKVLSEMAESGQLKAVQRGKYMLVKEQQTIIGILDVNRKGFGFVSTDKSKDDIFIKRNHMSDAIHGDKVTVEIINNRKGNSSQGKIIEVIDRDKRLIVGTLQISKKHAFLIPDDDRIDVDLFIPIEKVKQIDDGTKVVARIIDWPVTAKNPFGEIVEILGLPDSNEAEMKAILTANGIRYTFPEDVLNEANRIPVKLDEKEAKNRREFRNTFTITIDPVDAKDFDDALSVEFIGDQIIRVGIHIADVAHYIQENSKLDVEALKRGNSVYLVDRVIPMLPEHLSNGVCSLRPNEEKFCFSAVFDLDERGNIKKEWFGKTVICSDRRFTYEEAQKIIEEGKGEHKKEILALNKLAKTLRSERMKSGSLEVHSSELRFQLDEKGDPVGIIEKVSKDANKLVEEFMLLANRCVARFVGDTKKKGSRELVYRVHDKPDLEKLEQFKLFVSKFGHKFQYKGATDIAIQMNKLFKKLENEPEFGTVQQMAIKSMAKAAYDTENIGHFGLAFRYYAHFTSPIRRYADLLVHRILLEHLNGENRKHKNLSETAKHISATERKAIESERASNKYFQAKYLESEIGSTYTGIVTGVTDWGIYVQMHENHCEGMVLLKSISYDRFYFDEKNYCVVGSHTSDRINLGDVVEVELVRVSIPKRQIDLELIP